MGFALLVVAAFVGLLILVVPPWLAEQYDRFAAMGSGWAVVYLVTVGVDIDEEGGKRTVEMARELDGDVTYVKADLTRDSDIEKYDVDTFWMK